MTPPASLRLSPAEVGQLAAALSAAHLTLDLDETERQVPAGQRLAPRLHGRSRLLVRQQLEVEWASTRLEVPVVLDPPTTAHLLGLLEQAAAHLEAFADCREPGGWLIDPQRFRDQAAALRAWRADLAGRQRDPVCRQRDPARQRAEGAGR
jgi:hypothetical protein